MSTSTAIDIPTIVARYFDAWNASHDERVEHIAQLFSDNGYYCDGVAEASGPEAIAAMMEATFDQFPGASVELASTVDTHHSQARFAWRMRAADGTTMIDGIDAIRVDDSGRLTTVLGFFGTTIPETKTQV